VLIEREVLYIASFFNSLKALNTLVNMKSPKTSSFNMKTHEMFSIQATAKEFENATTTDHFGFLFDETSGKGKHMTIALSSFRKRSVFKVFFDHNKTKSRRL